MSRHVLGSRRSWGILTRFLIRYVVCLG
jgi:hypothetical protein